MNTMGKEDKYTVVMHRFIGTNKETGSCTYEITFNKSLVHTGRFKGIEDGLNRYCRKESMTNAKESLIDFFYSLVAWFKSWF